MSKEGRSAPLFKDVSVFRVNRDSGVRDGPIDGATRQMEFDVAIIEFDDAGALAHRGQLDAAAACTDGDTRADPTPTPTTTCVCGPRHRRQADSDKDRRRDGHPLANLPKEPATEHLSLLSLFAFDLEKTIWCSP
jgi:hypothetical protein